MHKKSLSGISFVLSIILIGGFLAGCSTSANTSSTSTGVVKEVTVTDTVESSGSVEPIQMAALKWGTSGTILQVNVSNGDSVTKGEVLLSLDPTTVPSSIITAQSDLTSAKQALTDLMDSKSAAAAAQLTLANAQVTYNDALGASYGASIPHGTVDEIAYLQQQIIIQKVAVSDAQNRYNSFSEASDTDARKAQAKASLISAQMQLNTLQLNLNYYQSTEDKNASAVTAAELAVAKAALDDAQRAYDLVKDGPTADQIAAAQAKVEAAQATVNNMNIIAPFSGTIVVLDNQAGDLVNTGDEGAVIVNTSQYTIDVLIDETQISQVKVGDTAEVTFAAVSGLKISGKVTSINPIGTSTSGVVNYTVRVTLDKTDPKILIGATSDVVITVSQPQTMLTVPVLAVQNDAQGEYVVRIVNGKSERVTVVSGKIIGTEVVVKGNLSAGDVVEVSSTSARTSSTSSSNNRGGFGGGGGGLIP